MIRRDVPLNAGPLNVENQSWLLISQVEHARLSHQLAAAWQGLLSDAPYSVREEFLAAVVHHDDGWTPWQNAPQLDPQHGRPYGFTEMPPTEAQAIWLRSIDVCAELSPLAGYVVASHFIHLQEKQDDDFADWARWLGEQDRRRVAWLAEWQSQSEHHTPELAEHCVYLLRTFDWLSLWLCCRAPVDAADPRETLELGDSEHHFGPFKFTPVRLDQIRVEPWPFDEPTMEITVTAEKTPAGRFRSIDQIIGEPAELKWQLTR